MKLTLNKDLERPRADAIQRIDENAEHARSAYLTPGAGQAEVYRLKEAEAQAFLDPDEKRDTYDFLEAEARLTGETVQEVAMRVCARAKLCREALVRIETLRLAAKAAAKSARNPAEIRKAEEINWNA